MARKEIPLPGLGEGVIEATVTRWLVKEGEVVEEEQPLVEIATDKVDSEVVSPGAGKVVKILHGEGETVKVGEPLLLLEDDSEEEISGKVIEVGSVREEIAEVSAEEAMPEGSPEAADVSEGEERNSRKVPGRFLSPLVRKIAREEGITDEELERIPGTGVNGRITKGDVLEWLSARKKAAGDQSTGGRFPEGGKEEEKAHTTVSQGDDDHEVIEMDRIRRLIADHMVESVRTAPHVTSFIEVDVTALVA